jgi:hypothetical protein
MEKLLRRDLYYCLSAWNSPIQPGTAAPSLYAITPRWQQLLRAWKARFGFDRCLYVDLSNEFPYFLADHLATSIQEHGPRWSARWNAVIRNEVHECLRTMRQEFPELRFTVSLHGDTRWIDLGLELDCLDIHFYADADQRFVDRTRFDEISADLFVDTSLYRPFSDSCVRAHSAMAPMFRARQRNKLAHFAAWSEQAGMPLTTSESWASWYYADHADLDWSWLLDWAEWSVEDAIELGMWGWTPHNYCQPQFTSWQDANWHRRLTDRFLRS